MDVGRVEAAGVHEADGGREAGADDGGEVGTVGEVDLTAGTGLDAGVGCGVEVELEVGWIHLREESVFLDLGGGELDTVDKVLRDGGIGSGGSGGGRADGGAPGNAGFGWGGGERHRPGGSLADIEGCGGDGGGGEAGEEELGVHVEVLIT